MTEKIKNQNVLEILVRTAWLSILLGLGMEVVLLIAAAGFKNSLTLKPIIADVVQKVSWSYLVCVGLAVGTAVSKMRGVAMGLAGLMAAPIGFYLARILHKSAAQALDIALPAASGPSPIILALIKACEYAVLGVFLSGLSEKSSAGIKQHVLCGLGVGLCFGGLIIFLTAAQTTAPLSVFSLVSRGLNEILFPVGCSLVIYSAQRLGSRLQ